jgi:hypothetical protein
MMSPPRASSRRRVTTRGHITSSNLDSRGAARRRRVSDHRQTVRPADRSRACLAAGRLGRQRCYIRGAHWIRARSPALFARRPRTAHSAGCRPGSFRACSRRRAALPVGHVIDPASVAPRPRCLAGFHRCSGISRCVCGRRDPVSPGAEGLTVAALSLFRRSQPATTCRPFSSASQPRQQAPLRDLPRLGRRAVDRHPDVLWRRIGDYDRFRPEPPGALTEAFFADGFLCRTSGRAR